MEYNVDKFKDIVDNMFKELDKSEEKTDGIPMHKMPSLNRPAKLTQEQEEFAKQKAMDELEDTRLNFLAFQDQCQGSAIYSYLITAFEQIGEYAGSVAEVIEDNVDESKLDSIALAKYQSIKKLRMQILLSVYNKYKKG
jgi:hypothetical protein